MNFKTVLLRLLAILPCFSARRTLDWGNSGFHHLKQGLSSLETLGFLRAYYLSFVLSSLCKEISMHVTRYMRYICIFFLMHCAIMQLCNCSNLLVQNTLDITIILYIYYNIYIILIYKFIIQYNETTNCTIA